jgi:hypothetical protein
MKDWRVKNMKYKPEEYSIRDTGFYGLGDEDIENYKEKLVKCRKLHKCAGGCEKDIPAGVYAIRETGFMDGQPVSTYTCTDCMDAWLDELKELGEEFAN